MKKTSNLLNCYFCQYFLILYFTHTSFRFEFRSLAGLSMAPKSPVVGTVRIPSSVDSLSSFRTGRLCVSVTPLHRLEEVCVFSSVLGIEPRASCTLGKCSTTGLFSAQCCFSLPCMGEDFSVQFHVGHSRSVKKVPYASMENFWERAFWFLVLDSSMSI